VAAFFNKSTQGLIMYVFTLPSEKDHEGRVIKGKHYVFQDGVATFNDQDGAKVQRILTKFYGCKCEVVADGQGTQKDVDDSGDGADLTNGGGNPDGDDLDENESEQDED
jgi:hypothetical protein